MDSLNFTIDGQLGVPGFVRVPPPFGTPRHAARTIHSTLARVQNDEQLAMAETERQALRAQWRQRLTAVAIGVACTAAAALIGSHTGKRSQPALHIDPAQHAAIAQAPVPSVPPEVMAEDAVPTVAAITDLDQVGASPVKMEVGQTPEAQSNIIAPADAEPEIRTAPVPAKSLDKPTKPRTLARASGRTAAPATAPVQPATTIYDEPVPLDTYRAMTDTAAITSTYVAPGTSMHFELQRHTRLTD